MKEKSDIAGHAGYLRHRMRILRSVVVLLPAMGVVILLHQAGKNVPWSGAMIIIIEIYTVLFVWQLLRLFLSHYSIGQEESPARKKIKKLIVSHPLLFLFAVPPKTDRGSAILNAYYKNSKHWLLRIVYLIQEPVFLLILVLYYYSSNIVRDPGAVPTLSL